MGREITEKEQALVDKMVSKAKSAMVKIENWTQRDLDRLSQAIAWYAGNEKTFTRLAQQGVDESGIGDRAGRPGKRFKIHMVLRDVLRTPSTGIVETDAKKGLVKYAKPAGVIASLIPMTNPAMTPPVTGVSSANARNAVIFSPHPRTAATTCERPSIPMTQYLMESCDLTLATGGKPMVQAAYSSGKPAYGVGAGNSTIVVDETADLNEAAKNIMISKTSDFGSGCSADGNIVIQKSIYRNMVSELKANNGYLCNSAEKELLSRVMWDDKENRTFSTIACKPQQLALVAGFEIPENIKFLMVENNGQIGKEHKFSKEKLTTLMALYYFEEFPDALNIIQKIYEVGGKGHSCGIYSTSDKNIDALARVAPVSRMMVRQPQSKSNAGSWTNGMPMTSSLGCGIWGGNITNENVTMKHMMNYTWVSKPIQEDRPSERELFGDFFGQEVA